MVYLDGVYAGAMDVNHTTVALEPDRAYRVGVYYYVGMHEQDAGFEPSVVLLDEREDELYYDLWTPFEGAKLLDPNTKNMSRRWRPWSARSTKSIFVRLAATIITAALRRRGIV
jgi:hypothetical protein